MGAAVPSTSEVEAEEVPANVQPPSVRNALKAPVPQALTTGDPQSATERDYYADALNEKHQRQFEESVGGIGSGILQAFTGVGPSQESLRQRQEYEEEPITKYLRQQQEADKARALDIQQIRAAKPTTAAAAKAMKDRDPNSAVSLRYRSALSARFPGAPKEVLANVTEENYDKLIETLEEVEKDKRARDIAGLQSSDREKARKQEADIASTRTDLGYAGITAAGERADKGLEAAKLYRDAMMGVHAEDKTESAATEFGRALATSGIPSAKAKVDELEGLFKKYPKDIPGIGFLSGAIPNRLESTDAKRVRMLIGQLGAEYQKSMTGAGASDAERARYDEVTGLLKRADPESVRLGVRMMAEDLGVKEAALEQAFPPEAVQKVRSRGKPTAGPPRVPAATALPTDSTGQPTLDAPADTVRVILNGKPKDVPRANLEKVKALAKQKGYSLEVPNG